ncbi:MAG TPA: LysM domain-containing protein [Conexibacter sp.]|nr:LysM domain-containing protein [Conexibacter sp.]
MARGTPARLAAPLALLAAAVAVVIVVEASRPGSSDSSGAARTTTTTQRARRPKPPPRFYTVRSGDTLTVIAQRTHVSLETIQRLNPQIDPNALQTGQRLKLSP